MFLTRTLGSMFVFLFVLSIAPLAGQDGEQAFIRGRVVDGATGEPLEFANVSVLRPDTDRLQSGGVTDLDGNFEIAVPPGTYRVKVDFLSYRSKTIDDVSLSDRTPVRSLGDVALSADAEVFEEVIVVGEKSQLQMGLDKRVFNVGKDLARTGGSATDLLDNIPSVAVDGDGNISLRGSQNVRIFIDGKPSGLIGIGGTDGLQLLQGNLIESIEIITNPSSKYQAEGSAGIINIILKKEQREGVNGSFDINTGFPHNHGVAANINLRKKFVNLFGNLGVSYRERPGDGSNFQEFTRPDTTYYIDRSREFERTGFGANMQIGADFFINPKNNLTASFLYRRGRDENFRETTYRNFNNLRELTALTSRVDNEGEEEYTLEYNLNYKRTFDRKGQEFTAAVQYQDNSEVEKSNILEQRSADGGIGFGGDPLRQRSENDEKQRQLLLQADYVHPLGKEGKVEAGYLTTIRQVDNAYLVEEFRPGEDWVRLSDFSNVFDYDEYVHALYATMGNKSGRFSYQAGLRAELSEINTELRDTREVNDRSYLSFFPSIYLGYELPGNNNIQVSYSRRIQRPRFWDLNPFFSFSDNRNIRSGNPNLNPMFTDSYEVNYLKYWDKTSLSGSVYYRKTDDVIQRITSLLNDTVTLSRPENLSLRDEYGVELILSSDIGKVWKLNGSVNFFRAITDGGDLGEEYAADTYSWNGRLNSRLRLWKKMDFQLMFNYRGAEREPQGRRRAFAYLDAGLNMDILKGKGNLELNVRDVFNSRRVRFLTEFPGYTSDGYFRWSVTTVTLGLTYRINQMKKRDDRRDGDNRDGGGGMEF